MFKASHNSQEIKHYSRNKEEQNWLILNLQLLFKFIKKTKTQTNKKKNMYAFLFFKSSRIFVQNGYVPKKNVLPRGEGAGKALLVKMLLQTLRIL